MSRPAIPLASRTANINKSEIAIRESVESRTGGKISATPPKELPENQKRVWKWIVKTMTEAGFLGILDEMTLREACDVIAGLSEVNAKIQEVGRDDRQLLAAKVAYNKMYIAVCGQLGLSPQARAKLGSLSVAAAKDKEDPLLEALSA